MAWENEPRFLHGIALRRGSVSSFDVFPYAIPTIRQLQSLQFHPRVTFFVGENGAGKSTLLEAIALAEGFNAEGGSRRHAQFKTRDSHDDELWKNIELNRGGGKRLARSDSYFVRAESFYNLASYLDDVGSNAAGPFSQALSYHQQSHGEAFMNLMTSRFGGNGLYLLDEPEAALSPQRQLAFLAALHELVQRGSQFIIATHSPIVLAYPDAHIYHFGERGIESIAYEDTEHYKVTRAFLLRRDIMLKELME
ncbi:AAA family ATPase [Anatilimnocola floriformis]|uniref:AAA family ATPase n=1 Tax=Anatilimnocola floriformis TaxID=2948575 RepID=UPI0020C445AC|nr:AAA family ATPase [Anatilimnocola floriformis]